MQSAKPWTKCVSLPNYWVFRGITSLNILLTRALTQVQPLQTLLSQHGYQPILFPSLEIEPLSNTALKSQYDVLIFISSNAVEHGLKVLKNLEHQPSKLFAVGIATAKKLQEYGIKVDAFPSKKASSEALLALPEIKALANKKILIFRGKGGRETLKEGLESQNTVEYIEVYQRVVCHVTPLHQQALSTFLQSDKGIISATSIGNLSALLLIIEQMDINALNAIKGYPLVALSERIKIFAQSVGFTQIEVATKTSDKGLLEAVTNLTKS